MVDEKSLTVCRCGIEPNIWWKKSISISDPGVRVFAGVTVKPAPLVGSQQVPDGDRGRPYEQVG